MNTDDSVKNAVSMKKGLLFQAESLKLTQFARLVGVGHASAGPGLDGASLRA